MTGRDAEREQLAAALAEADGVLWNSLSEKIGTCDVYRKRAAALLPVVDRIANQRAAAMLRAAAAGALEVAYDPESVQEWLIATRARAASLRADGTTT